MNADVYNIVEAYNLVNACYVMIMATIIDEFEQRIYALDDETISNMTSEEIDAVMESVCEAYGGDSWVVKLSDPYAYWRMVCISNPVYYISYATSSIAALNIYTIAKEDEELARETYRKLVEEINEDDGFKTVMDKIGLGSPFESESMKSLADGLLK